MPVLAELRRLLNVLTIVESNLEQAPNVAQAKRCVGQIQQVIANRLRHLHDSLAVTRGPLPGSSADSSLAARCGLSASMSFDQGGAVIQRAWGLYFDLLGHLAATTLHGEQTLKTTTTPTTTTTATVAPT